MGYATIITDQIQGVVSNRDATRLKQWIIDDATERVYKCSEKSIKVKLAALLGNYDRSTDKPTNQPTDRWMMS